MVGNVFEWIEDCYHSNYSGAPTDGSGWLADNGGDCTNRGARGGSWTNDPDSLRSAARGRVGIDVRNIAFGIRVARTLSAGAGAIKVAPGVR
jgi:formylglycine-generating enzyme required for sulfatase activity